MRMPEVCSLIFGLCWVVVMVRGLSVVVARLVASLVAEHRL